ncbi:MAG: hypothetical protein JO250_09270 [Armatimonadetes bacterium]|nr:hypothetical protein [Armatimonadota bacterium]
MKKSFTTQHTTQRIWRHLIFLGLAAGLGSAVVWLWSLAQDAAPGAAFWAGALALVLAAGSVAALIFAHKEMD